ncbi:hypothetical protein SUGI_0509920 [Cryptomeria japonica]|nr:hypothetical protein SUGI_0509920 [Cryptomeria japonica]
MKVISWNIRGLNGLNKQDILRNPIRDQNLDIILVQKTKMSKEKVEKLNFFQNGGVCGSSSNGASGGVAIFWNKKTISREMIDVDGNILWHSIYSSI